MNGRVFAVNRSPVLAWNVEVPYPDMPAAAAAAISPIVPAASDPYGRCWQNQVDPGSSFPYFGALYNNSLPPTAYRLQPGCMPNLGGQFWPPTPPPDGCGRFDSSNLYFGAPVLRHGENISSNIRSSFQSLGHYSHLIETPKEPSQRIFKQETPISSNVSSSSVAMCSSGAKSDNPSTCCVVESKLKSQCSVSHSLPKQELLTVSSGQEPYFFAPDIRSSSSMHPSTDKSCFSSTYSLKNSQSIHSPPQENILKSKSVPVTQENNCNASPLKNVYFSHYESENINSTQCKSFEKNGEEHFYSDKHNSLNSIKSRPQTQPLSDYHHSNHFSKKYDYHNVHNFHKVTPSHRVSNTSLKDQYKLKSCSSRIKPEKTNHFDCKYQKSNSRSSTVVHVPESKSSDVLNIPTSAMLPKMEPKDKYFMSSCSSTASSCMAASYASSTSPFLMSSSSSRTASSSYQHNIYPNSCSLSKPWSYNELPMITPDNYFKSPEAAKPPSHNQAHVASAFHEGLISVAQTAPPDIQIVKDVVNGLNQAHVSPIHQKKTCSEIEDDDVQIIGVQNKSSCSKNGKYILDKRLEYHQSSAVINPLCLKSEKQEESVQEHISTSQDRILNTTPPIFGRLESIFVHSPVQSDPDEKSNQTSMTNIKSQAEIPSLNVPEETTLQVPAIQVKKENEENTFITLSEESPGTVEEDSKLEKDIKIVVPPPNEYVKTDTSELVLSTSADSKISNPCEQKDIIKHHSLPEFSENHGLNLLLATIEKVTSFEAIDSPKPNIISKNIKISIDTERVSNPSCKVLKTRGLELLSTIAVERLVSEFDVIKIEPKDSPVISNYPQIKEEQESIPEDEYFQQKSVIVERVHSLISEVQDKLVEPPNTLNYKQIELSQIKEEKKSLSEDETNKQNSDTVERTSSSVFEMRDKLVELQKKYKQKQKELSRLKPKKRFANIYLKCCHNVDRENLDQTSASNSSNCVLNGILNTSQCSSVCQAFQKEDSAVSESQSEAVLKVESDDTGKKRPKRNLRIPPFKKESSVEILSDEEVQEIYVHKRITRRSSGRNSMKFLRSNVERKRLSVSLHSKNIKHGQRRKFSRLRKKKEQSLSLVSDDVSSKQSSNNNICIKSSSLPENIKKSKTYSLRHSSQVSLEKLEADSNELAPCSKVISSKRKSDNPKRYVPSKQGKMSETIIAKHLRSRILFDTSGSFSDEENAKDSVPDDLYDALMKCHLVDERNKSQIFSDDEGSEISSESPLGYPEPSKLTSDNLIERQRLLALEDGLFYAGYIKECQSSNKYGIALDGQRGNRLHTFTKEELLTQTIVESKPVSSELPEGTRVCAYWSQQYRCLYPGVIGKAPCPSADWSEPRVFVQFDDGDSGQIPTKNVRLIPIGIIPSGSESRLDSSSTSSTYSDLKCKEGSREKMPRRLRSSTPKKKHKSIIHENESKESSCTSINDSSCDDSCFMDYSLSPSQNADIDNNQFSKNNSDYSKSEKRQRKHSKRKIASRTKSRDSLYPEAKGKSEAKIKRHKKYKDKHRRHHHHHHRHHHHHHHHHHSKKRKHRRKTGKSPTSQELAYENCIPCKSNLKSHKAFEVASTDLIEHSSTIHLPHGEQDNV